MRTETNVVASVDELVDENWLYFDPDPTSDVDIVRITPENIKRAAEFYGLPENFIKMLDDALREMANDIIGALKDDLEDIWEKLD